jgi:hypothetical protein
MGARSAQVFSEDDLSSTMVTPVGDGWWRVSLQQFLVIEGWTRVGGTDTRAVDRRTGRTGRRSRRKAVES